MPTAARNTRARRKRSIFKSQRGQKNPYIGAMNNQCGCMDCRGRSYRF